MNRISKLPYLTEADLCAAVDVYTLTVEGKYTKRGEQRKEVYEDDYVVDIEVPKNWNMGHVKLGANRYIKNELKGIRARTFLIDESSLTKSSAKKKVRDFMSAQSLIDNETRKKDYERMLEQRRARTASNDSGMLPFDNTNYDENGLPVAIDR